MTIHGVARKESLASSGREAIMRRARVREFLWRELFLMDRAVNFIPYAGRVGSQVPDWASERGLDLIAAIQLPGCRMTARRSALIREPFEPAIRSYSPGEDFDISYRLSRIGSICVARSALIYHHEVAASRIRREQELMLSICNFAYRLRRHSPNIVRDRRRWSVLIYPRLLAEFLKDGLTRRFKFKQLRAAWRASKFSKEILYFTDNSSLEYRYIAIQDEILNSLYS